MMSENNLFQRIQSFSETLLLPANDDKYIPVEQHVKSSFAGNLSQCSSSNRIYIGFKAYQEMVNSRL